MTLRALEAGAVLRCLKSQCLHAQHQLEKPSAAAKTTSGQLQMQSATSAREWPTQRRASVAHALLQCSDMLMYKVQVNVCSVLFM